MLMLCCFTGSVFALDTNNVDLSDLSEQQRAEILMQVAKAKDKTDVVDSVNKWVGIGKELGAGLGSAAKEMGVTVNEFASTPVGQMTTFAILWKVFYQDVIKLVVGLLWLSFSLIK